MSFPHTYIIIEWLTCVLTPTSSISAICITRTNSIIYRTTVESHYAKIGWVKFSDESKWFPDSVSNYVKVNCFCFFFLKFEPRGKVYSIQHYVIAFASDLLQVVGHNISLSLQFYLSNYKVTDDYNQNMSQK